MPKPTAQDVKQSLPGDLVRRIEVDRSETFSDAARKAALWVKSRHLKAGLGDPDYDDDLVFEAAIERAKYEVYAMRETEEVAADKKENAAELLEPIVGEAADADDQAAPAASVQASTKPAWMEGFEGRSNPEESGTRRVP